MQVTKKIPAKRWRYYEELMRFFDIAFVIVALLVSWPLLLIVALMIKMENIKAPVLFRQRRVGKDGATFYIYKFRSMHTNAENLLAKLQASNEMDGQMFKMKRDPRITKIGMFIRKFSIDELPQFYNVLKGEMSMIGPRPALISEYENYSTLAKRRVSVKPGCTGLWQVSGRNKLTFDEMIRLDLHYIENQSLVLNIKILFRTIKEFTHLGSGY
ncbi:sugar transferase [Carnobacterium maltaromaticum]|uniref:Sugar transferase n=1 Tax=Carnobacterium maltaromaticum TaxID=2751 RepID=A0AAW9JXB0_CARML|nr:sugar transferase [Carnobacterium maltaromaticum]MDZ5759259.1 sugar transferase [Carnobacterium maltaromaticum]